MFDQNIFATEYLSILVDVLIYICRLICFNLTCLFFYRNGDYNTIIFPYTKAATKTYNEISVREGVLPAYVLASKHRSLLENEYLFDEKIEASGKFEENMFIPRLSFLEDDIVEAALLV